MKTPSPLIISLTMAFASSGLVCNVASAQEPAIHAPEFAMSAAAAKKIISDAKGEESWSTPGLIADYRDGDDKVFCSLTVDPGAELCGSVSSLENAQSPYLVVISNATGSSLCDDLRMLAGIGGERCASFYGKASLLEDGTTPAVSGVTKYQIEPVDMEMLNHPVFGETPLLREAELKRK